MDYSKFGVKTHKAQDVCFLPFSSGTTGLPKGVMLNHRNWTSFMKSFTVPGIDKCLELPTTKDYQEVLPCILPFFHCFGFGYSLLGKLALGCKLVTLPRFDPVTYLSTISNHKGTILQMVPPILLFLANDDRCTSKLMSSVRSIYCGAAPVGAEVIDRLRSSK